MLNNVGHYIKVAPGFSGAKNMKLTLFMIICRYSSFYTWAFLPLYVTFS